MLFVFRGSNIKIVIYNQYLVLKKYILFLPLFFTSFILKAQVEDNYFHLAVGAGSSYVRGYTNLNIQQNHFAENVNVTYYYTAYIPITAEIQKGTLSGGSITLDPSKRQYTNNYLAFLVHADLQFGQIIDPYNDLFAFAKDFYVGTGAGLMNDNDKVQRISPNDPTYVFPGKDRSINLMMPLRVGYEIKVLNAFSEPIVRIDIGYVQNFVFGQGLDGYNDPPSKFKHNNISQYRQISLGLIFGFGAKGR
jgi:hypothetical protein